MGIVNAGWSRIKSVRSRVHNGKRERDMSRTALPDTTSYGTVGFHSLFESTTQT